MCRVHWLCLRCFRNLARAVPGACAFRNSFAATSELDDPSSILELVCSPSWRDRKVFDLQIAGCRDVYQLFGLVVQSCNRLCLAGARLALFSRLVKVFWCAGGFNFLVRHLDLGRRVPSLALGKLILRIGLRGVNWNSLVTGITLQSLGRVCELVVF